jgi:hypothetical protein
MSETKDFYDNLKAIGIERQRLLEENQALRARLERLTMQAEWVVESYDKYLVAQTKGRLDDIKTTSIKFSGCLAGLDLLARRERISE